MSPIGNERRRELMKTDSIRVFTSITVVYVLIAFYANRESEILSGENEDREFLCARDFYASATLIM